MCGRIVAKVEEELKGEAKHVIDRVVRSRCHEALFLSHLALAAEEVIQLGRRADALQLLAMVQEFQLLLLRIETGYVFDEPRLTKQVTRWRQTLVGFYGTNRGQAAAVTALEEEYFGGESMLYPATRRLLETIFAECQRLVSLYEDVVGEAEHQGGDDLLGFIPAVDGGKELEQVTRAASVAEARVLLDRARVEAFRAMGQDEAALEVYRSYVAHCSGVTRGLSFHGGLHCRAGRAAPGIACSQQPQPIAHYQEARAQVSDDRHPQSCNAGQGETEKDTLDTDREGDVLLQHG
jgi:hypothetical protein